MTRRVPTRSRRWIARRLRHLITSNSLRMRTAIHRHSTALDPHASDGHLLERIPPILASTLLTRGDELQIRIARVEMRLLTALDRISHEEGDLRRGTDQDPSDQR